MNCCHICGRITEVPGMFSVEPLCECAEELRVLRERLESARTADAAGQACLEDAYKELYELKDKNALLVEALGVALNRLRHLQGLHLEGELKPLNFIEECELGYDALAVKEMK